MTFQQKNFAWCMAFYLFWFVMVLLIYGDRVSTAIMVLIVGVAGWTFGYWCGDGKLPNGTMLK